MKYGGIPFKQNATYDIYRQDKGTGILPAKWIKINTFFQCMLSLVLVISFEDDPSPPFADELFLALLFPVDLVVEVS